MVFKQLDYNVDNECYNYDSGFPFDDGMDDNQRPLVFRGDGFDFHFGIKLI